MKTSEKRLKRRDLLFFYYTKLTDDGSGKTPYVKCSPV